MPPSWAAATPTVRLAATVLQSPGAAAGPLVGAGEGSLFGQMALGSLACGAAGGALPRAATRAVARREDSGAGDAEDRPGDDTDTSGEDKGGKKQDKLNHVLAELSQNPDTVQHWHTDKAHLDGLLEQLSSKPGVHAVRVSARHKPQPPRPRWG